MASSVGEHAYTVPKNELLEWANRLLELQLTRLEQFASGAVYCQLFDAYHTGKLNMAKVNFAAVFDYEFVTNYKQLQIGLNKMEVDKNIDVERLIKGHPSENLEFLQWLYYYCRRTGKSAGYTARERRSASRGGNLAELPLPHSTVKPLNPVGGYNTPLSRQHDSGLLEPNGEVKDCDTRHKYIPNKPTPRAAAVNSPRAAADVEPRVRPASRRTASQEAMPTSPGRPASARHKTAQNPGVSGGQARPMGSANKSRAAASPSESGMESSPAPAGDAEVGPDGFVLDPATAQVADDAAQQAVTVLLRSLPGLKRLLGQVGSETHDGYTHRGKLRSRRDVMQTLVQHTWVLLRDLHLNSMNSGGMGGRTRARRLENLQKELQGAQALFEELCEEVDKAEKFFPIPEGALASLAAAKQAAGEGKQMDTRQLDQALRAVGAAQTSLAPLHKASLIAAEAQCHHADSILAQAREALASDGGNARPPFRITVKPDTMGYVGSINNGAYKDTEDWLAQLRNFPEDPDKPRFHVPFKGDDPDNIVSALHGADGKPTTPRSGGMVHGGAGGLAKYGLGDYGEAEAALTPRSRAAAPVYKVMSPEATQMVSDQVEDSAHHSTQYASSKPRRMGEGAAAAAAIGMSVAVGAALSRTAGTQAGSADGVDGGNDARSPSFASRGVGGGPPKTFASAGVGADLDAEGQQEADAVAAALAVAKVEERVEDERAEEEALTAAATKSAAMKAVGMLADLDYTSPQTADAGTDYASQLPAVPSQMEDAKPVVAATLTPNSYSKSAQAGDCGGAGGQEVVEVRPEEGHLTSRVLKGRDLKEVTYEVRKLANGDGYKGPYLRGHKAGEGVYSFSNGDVYAGEFFDDQMEGYGVYVFANQGRYEGQWVRALYEGVGMETFARGSTYHGEYAKGMRCGFGICRYYNGDYYEGQWQAGLRHGRGMQQCTDESNYVGDYNSGKRHGLGVYSFPNGDRYMGQYQSDVPHGYGVYLFASGQKYEGQWYHGKKHGFCIYTIETGEQWAGEWRESKPKWVQSLAEVTHADDANGRANAASVARATKAAEEARSAAKDGASRADEHWRTNGPMQLGVRDVVLRADRAAAEAQSARQRALAVAASIDEGRRRAEEERATAAKTCDADGAATAPITVNATTAAVAASKSAAKSGQKKPKGLRKLLSSGKF
mmetsp:Transcript_21663/g.55568  ORF Transcript_21663/g.55568 Transcript_21663/m.55568 type:complete len:1179 (+) Transcript_21663:358-3894(+)|eukprot:jgi/Tetstr1/427461/TSEL_001760.t1